MNFSVGIVRTQPDIVLKKKISNREKDLNDIKIVKEYLKKEE